jgi:predicted aspartyl protease
MTGEVDDRGTPIVRLDIGGQKVEAIIDTGFDGAVLLPSTLAHLFTADYWGDVEVTLAGGQTSKDKMFTTSFPFDGELRSVHACFGAGPELLIGTELLSEYRLEISFVERTVLLEKVTAKSTGPPN